MKKNRLILSLVSEIKIECSMEEWFMQIQSTESNNLLANFVVSLPNKFRKNMFKLLIGLESPN